MPKLAEGYITERGEEFVRIDTQVLYNEFSMACMLSYALLLQIAAGIHIYQTTTKDSK